MNKKKKNNDNNIKFYFLHIILLGDGNIIKKLIGNTPMIRLKKIEKHYNLKAKLYAKMELLNLSGSIKDRAALEIILDLIKEKKINKGSNTVIIEATSGNMGISLALMSNYYDYEFIAVMPEDVSKERISLIKSFNGKVILTDKDKKMQGSIDKVNELLKEKNKKNNNMITVKQFENISNVKAHYKTGKEIYDYNKNINSFIAGIGTGGTITGIGEYLKSKNKDIKIIGVEPKTEKHQIQGIGANLTPKILNKDVIDSYIKISDEEAFKAKKELLEIEGIFAGISSGANLAAMIKYAKLENKDINIVTVFPDRGERYISLLKENK